MIYSLWVFFAPRLPVHICSVVFVTDWKYSHGSWNLIFSLVLVTSIYGSEAAAIAYHDQTESVLPVLFWIFSSCPSTSNPGEVSQYMQVMPPALLSFSLVTCGDCHGTFALRCNAHVSIFDSFWFIIFSWQLTTDSVSVHLPYQMTVDDMANVSQVGVCVSVPSSWMIICISNHINVMLSFDLSIH